jgi:hypothetical protein
MKQVVSVDGMDSIALIAAEKKLESKLTQILEFRGWVPTPKI